MLGNVPQLPVSGDNLKALKASVDAALAQVGVAAPASRDEVAAAAAAIMAAAQTLLTNLGFALSETREKAISADLNRIADASYNELS